MGQLPEFDKENEDQKYLTTITVNTPLLLLTTWTKYYPILTSFPSSGQLLTFCMISILCHVTKDGLPTDPLPLLVHIFIE